ncbi:survival of motor neuron-related-splicing factor 30 isoform X2 [Aplysia californica]|uniref:Survival of motor neuron-related-splicing factor 30 n=1 Tax=Aplysia californica TaxID=6500 RepID=A0ABM1AAL1_APLCA|nr:survival of motor neuron-related-splicing factor 30 isoform X2 [Aplysia californica]
MNARECSMSKYYYYCTIVLQNHVISLVLTCVLGSCTQEVIALTAELISQPSAPSAEGHGATAAAGAGSGASAAGSGAEASGEGAWNIGDSCMALYQEDGQHYEAVIEEILEDGTCTVTYTGYNNSAICPISQLKSIDDRLKRGAKGDRTVDAKKSKKDLIAEQREYKRKKSQKKAQRMKQLEEEHEQDKNRWLDFNVKAFSKTSKGKVKKSIFATPDSVSGKVGVGTCGSGGKPMTSYQHQEKWKK